MPVFLWRSASIPTGLSFRWDKLYVDAFDDVSADVRYTYTISGLEQDVIILEQVPPPESFRFPPESTRLEVWTEFLSAPAPVKSELVLHRQEDEAQRTVMAQPDLTDTLLDFGETMICLGRAFSVPEEDPTVAPLAQDDLVVVKRWETIADRTFLIEAVEYQAIKPHLERLPGRTAQVAPSPRGVHASRRDALPALASLTPEDPRAMEVASAPYQPRGLVLDYLQIHCATNLTLASNTTYRVVNNLVLRGTTTIQPCYVKYAPGTSLVLYGEIACQTSSTNQAYFVAETDNSVGETIVPGAPVGQCAMSPLWLLSASNGTTLAYLDIRNAARAVTIFSPSMGHTIQHSRLVDCGIGAWAASTTVNLSNLTVWNVPTLKYNGGYATFTETNTVTRSGCSANDLHGNSISAAAVISPGTNILGAINCPGDEDFFSISLNAPAVLEVYTTGATNTYGHLLNASGNELAADDDCGSGDNFRISHVVPAGTHYVRVRHASPSATGGYTLRAEANAVGPATVAPMVTGVTFNPSALLRNDFTGWVGFRFAVGASNLTLTGLGRWELRGNSNAHTLKLVAINGVDVPGASTTVQTAGAATNAFVYANLPNAVTLFAGNSYYLVSCEAEGGDRWYSHPDCQLAISAEATGLGPGWSYLSPTQYFTVNTSPPESYGPVSLHYLVLPPDSDEDGLLDSWEWHYFGNLLQTPEGDPDGDGLSNGEEYASQLNTNPNDSDTDYDGCSDRQEWLAGTDPLDEDSFTPLRLGYWRFNTTDRMGEAGQMPLEAYGVESVSGWAGNAVRVPGLAPANLKYRDVEASGLANINCRRGTVRFWFRPNWSSNPGPGVWGRLLETGNFIDGGADGFWSLYLNTPGTRIEFYTQGDGSSGAWLANAVNWSAGTWHEIVLTYSPTTSALCVDRVLVATGTGVSHYPSKAVRLATGLNVGSDWFGNERANGDFDELETFNHVLATNDLPAAIRMTSPVAGTNITFGTSIALEAEVIPGSSPLAAVGFYTNACLFASGSFISNRLYRCTWSSPPVGKYAVHAVATDNQGRTNVSNLTVFTVNPTAALPTVSITAPTNGFTAKAGADFIIVANAHHTSGIAEVDFYAGTNFLGSDLTPHVLPGPPATTNFTVTVNGLNPGTYELTARAKDHATPAGRDSSAAVTITMQNPVPSSANGYWDPRFGNFDPPGPTCHQLGSSLVFDSSNVLVFGGRYCNSGGSSTLIINSNCDWILPFGFQESGFVDALCASGTNLYLGGRLNFPLPSTAVHVGKRVGTQITEIGDGLDFSGAVLCGPRLESDPSVWAIAVIDGEVIIGGDFTATGTDSLEGPNTNITYIARLLPESDKWSALGSNKLNGRVSALAEFQDTLYIGGRFTAAGLDSEVRYLARLVDGSWEAVGSGVNGPVLALKAHRGRLFVGGAFSTAGGLTNANCIAAWDGINWSPINHGVGNGTPELLGVPCTPTNQVAAIAARGDDLFVTGDFTTAWNGANPVSANYIARATWSEDTQSWQWSCLAEGLAYDAEAPNHSELATGRALAVQELPDESGYEVIVAGSFNKAGGVVANHVARWLVGQSACSTNGPSIEVIVPSPHARITDTSITFLAEADPNVIDVGFYLDGSFLGGVYDDNVLAWSYGPFDVPPGSHTVKAVAQDGTGSFGASAPVHFTRVSANGPVASPSTFHVNSQLGATNLNVLDYVTGQNPLRIVDANRWANPFGTSAGGSAEIAYGGTALVFRPNPDAFGTAVVSFEVVDNGGQTNTGHATVIVHAPPQVSITLPAEDIVIPSATATNSIAGAVWDFDSAISNVKLFVNGTLYATQSNFPFTWTGNGAGFYTFVAIAQDSDGLTNTSTPVTLILDPPGGVPPEAAITSLVNDEMAVTGTLAYTDYPVLRDGLYELRGRARDLDTPASTSYQVLVSRPSEPDKAVLNVTPNLLDPQGFHHGQDTEGVLGMITLSSLPNGVYDLTLIVRSAGDVARDSVRFALENDLKIGAFSFSEQDLSLPVGGLPLTVVRTYNSLNLTEGDFGPGWTMALNDVDAEIDEDRAMTDLFASLGEDAYDRTELQFSRRTGGGRNVTLTLPEGRRTTFVFTPRIGPLAEAYAAWSAAPGITAELQMRGDTKINFLNQGWGPPVWSGTDGMTPFEAYDIQGFNLRLLDGTVYELTRAPALPGAPWVYFEEPDNPGQFNRVQPFSGKLQVTNIWQPRGDCIRVTPGAITHYLTNGVPSRTILISRDPTSGRIAEIRDPFASTNGLALVKYIYHADTGNLLQVHRLVDRAAAAYVTNKYHYDHPRFLHFITSIEDADGVPVVRNEFDDVGRLLKHTDADGKVIRYVHDTTDRLEQVIDRLNNTNCLAFDKRGNVVAITNALGTTVQRISTFGYDTNNNLIAATNAIGVVTRVGYDTHHLPLAITNAFGTSLQQVATNSYDSTGLPLVSTDARGFSSTNAYDSRGSLLTVANADGVVVTNVYDTTHGWLVGTLDATGVVTTNYYDSATGDLRRSCVGYYAGGSWMPVSTNGYGYDVNGNRIAFTNALGVVTRYGHDAQNRVIAVTNALGLSEESSSTTVYDLNGRVARTVNALGVITAFGYDAQGRRTSVTNALGTAVQQVTAYAYDAEGNLTSVVDALGRSTDFAYDSLKRQVRTIFPATVTGGTRTGITNVYDALDRRLAVTNQAGLRTGFGYDALSRFTSVTNALNRLTSYQYDATGNQTNQIDALSRSTKFSFDALGRRTKRELPLSAWEGFRYDRASRLLAQTNFNGTIITNQYDQVGRLWKRWNGATPVQTNLYSALGQLTNRLDASGTHTWIYDALGRLKTNSTPAGKLYYTYDAVGNLLTLGSSTATTGVTNKYQYDALSRLTNVVDLRLSTGKKNTGYGFDAVGNLQWVKYNPNGLTNLYRYDALNRLTNLVWAKTNALRAGFGYVLGPTGNRLSLAETNNGSLRNYTWGYDDAYRLTSEQIATTAPTGTLNYGYDDVGNRLSRNAALGLPSQSLSYDQRDQIDNDATPTTASTYFDANGNNTAYGGTFTYDWANRLLTQASPSVTLTYDADGNRIKKVAGGVTNWYLVATVNPSGHPQVVEELTGTTPGTLSKAYRYGLDLIDQRVISPASTRFYGYDGLGSVKFLTDTGGTITDTYTYDAYGNLIASATPTSSHYRFTGEQWDSDLSLYYLRARYMHAGLGRFQTSDSFQGMLQEPPSLHRYLYASANPVNFVDPTGMFSQQLGYLAEDAIQEIYAMDHPGDAVDNGRWTRFGGAGNPAFRLKPDILNHSTKRWAEIKPFSYSGLAKGGAQYLLYSGAFAPFRYYPDAGWQPSTHFTEAGTVPIFFFNAGGVIFYTDALDMAEDATALATVELARQYFLKNSARLAGRTLVPALSRIGGVAIGGRSADAARFQTHVGIAGLLTTLGGL
ncbi:MAG: hypothetical protein HS113_06970 [Verrucomicrobiales bacterium]|nr:hypothetical protein [Verrucomicrobiales bacterium]